MGGGLPQGARLLGLKPYYVRVPLAPETTRRARLAVVRRVGLKLVALRRRRLAIWGWAVLVVWVASPLQTFLSGVDPALPPSAQDGTPLYRYARYAACLLPLAAAAGRGERLFRLGRAAWPMLLFLGYALMSGVWSQDRETSAKAILAGAPMLLTALGLGVAVRPPQLVQVLRLALAASVLGSVAAVALLPRYAVAGPHDLIGASAPGDWRGLYGHKNTLGHVAALAAVVFAGPKRRRRQSDWLCGPALVAAAACLAGSRCTSGLLIAAAALALAWAPRRGGAVRIAALAFAAAGLAAAFAARALILAAAFATLGKDATLSGRTLIWNDALVLASHRPLFGWGLDYAVSPPVAARLTLLFGVDHVHNAGLDLYFSLGAVGLVLAGAALAWALRPGGGSAASAALRSVIVSWLLSGLTEDMGVRAEGPIALFGLCALFGLFASRCGRSSFRRPVFRFAPAWTAPLRPPRLRSAA